MTGGVTSETVALLDRLVAFSTISRDPNRELIDFIAARLRDVGVESTIIPSPCGHKANLFATIGPADQRGVMLSGHTDVVPVEGQDWTRPPFELSETGGRLYGRGTADMKGFVAAAVAAARRAASRELASPLTLAFSYDEEVGCLGVHSLIEMLAAAPVRPAFCIVGEPTSMTVATGHKGKIAIRATCRGREAHSALAPTGLNAIHLACDLVAAIRAEQARIALEGTRDGDYDIAYTTLHSGRIAGGIALNIVPNHCELDWEIRNLAEDAPETVIARVRAEADRIVEGARETAPEAAITFEEIFSYPGLGTPPDAEVVRFVQALTGSNVTIKVAFGTEGGLFSERLGVPTVICGPGSMSQGHKPDEYVSRDQLDRCDAMLERLLERLEVGL